MRETHSESAHGHCLGIGGELPVFVVRPHAPNRDARTVMVRYEYMYRATPSYLLIRGQSGAIKGRLH